MIKEEDFKKIHIEILKRLDDYEPQFPNDDYKHGYKRGRENLEETLETIGKLIEEFNFFGKRFY